MPSSRDALGEQVLGEGAVLEGLHVALDSGLSALEFGFDGAAFLVVLAGRRGRLLASFGEHPGEGVELDERVKDGGFEGVGSDAFAGAGGPAVAAAAPAHVVAVAVALASGRGAHVAPPAAVAGHQPREQVVGVGVGVA
ncbi:MAG TPA: hypothetical protein VKI20_08580, partial [Acidimicrobiales bacterium]|nr:hypothetical protein [Acidimicrobiales bacterium]